ncbi:hypothetical protein A5752_17335 [Mycobacterium sp. 852002-51961_SCH5331710]|nr:hypothetical protein A5752_17335 [Mycobacterium sp. 852002-51961_SCH5331710]
MWKWASVSRSAVGAKQLGAYLHSLGPAPGVEIVQTDREHVVELRGRTGRAILPMSQATVFSHVMPKSADEIERMVRQGIK